MQPPDDVSYALVVLVSDERASGLTSSVLVVDYRGFLFSQRNQQVAVFLYSINGDFPAPHVEYAQQLAAELRKCVPPCVSHHDVAAD